jgi:hypothetical protein
MGCVDKIMIDLQTYVNHPEAKAFMRKKADNYRESRKSIFDPPSIS